MDAIDTLQAIAAAKRWPILSRDILEMFDDDRLTVWARTAEYVASVPDDQFVDPPVTLTDVFYAARLLGKVECSAVPTAAMTCASIDEIAAVFPEAIDKLSGRIDGMPVSQLAEELFRFILEHQPVGTQSIYVHLGVQTSTSLIRSAVSQIASCGYIVDRRRAKMRAEFTWRIRRRQNSDTTDMETIRSGNLFSGIPRSLAYSAPGTQRSSG